MQEPIEAWGDSTDDAIRLVFSTGPCRQKADALSPRPFLMS